MRFGFRSNTRSIPGSDLQGKALGIGDPNSASKVAGKHKAVWASIDLAGGGAVAGTVREYDVLHDLKEVPTSVVLDSIENAAVAGTSIIANAARRENWSATHVHVSLTLVAGSFEGCRANFLVSGR